MFVSCKCRVLPGTGPCVRQIPCPEESYRLCVCACVCPSVISKPQQ